MPTPEVAMAQPPRTPERPGRREQTDAEDGVEMKQVAGRVRADALNRIGELADRHPEAVANVLRRWMNQG